MAFNSYRQLAFQKEWTNLPFHHLIWKYIPQQFWLKNRHCQSLKKKNFYNTGNIGLYFKFVFLYYFLPFCYLHFFLFYPWTFKNPPLYLFLLILSISSLYWEHSSLWYCMHHKYFPFCHLLFSSLYNSGEGGRNAAGIVSFGVVVGDAFWW